MSAIAVSLADRAGFDLADQVVLVSERPSVRQLLGLAVAWTRVRRQERLLSPQAVLDAEDPMGLLRGLGLSHVDLAVISADATPLEKDAALRLAPARVG